MKKLSILIILITITLSSCDQIAAFFATLTANRTEGSVEDEFTFTVDTNDTIIGWYVDDQSIPYSSRSAVSESFTFEPGNHTITVETENVDPVSIEVYVYEPQIIFNVTLEEWGGFVSVSYDHPILKYEMVQGNLYEISDSMANGLVTVDDNGSIISVDVKIKAWSWAVNGMAGIKATGLSESEFIDYLDTLYSIEEPIESWSSTVFYLRGITSTSPDSFYIYDNYLVISGILTSFENVPYTVAADVRTLNIEIKVDTSDATIFTGNNLINIFGMDYRNLTLEELKDVAEILRRFPEEGIWDLAMEFNS